MSLYEDPNVTERSVTVVFTFAADDANDPVMRGDLVDRVTELADSLGYDYEIHHEDMLEGRRSS